MSQHILPASPSVIRAQLEAHVQRPVPTAAVALAAVLGFGVLAWDALIAELPFLAWLLGPLFLMIATLWAFDARALTRAAKRRPLDVLTDPARGRP